MNGHSISNWLLFMAAALWASGLAIGLTFDFFRNESRVSAEIVLLGLGFIAAYAGNNKLFKASCGKNGEAKPRAKPGEWVFAFLVVWAVAMATLYHTNALWYWMEKCTREFRSVHGGGSYDFHRNKVMGWIFLHPQNKQQQVSGEEQNYRLDIIA